MTPGIADTTRVETTDRIVPRWELPSEPAADVLRGIQTDPTTGDLNTEEFARGLGLEAEFLRSVLDGTKRQLTIDEIAQVCDALHCTPPDLWGTQLAASITHAYGPEQWPAERQPLDEIPGADPTPEAMGPWFATAYRTTHVIVVTPAGERIPLDDLEAPADPTSDYYLAFWQMSHPQLTGIDVAERITVPASGHDSHPVLAPIADDIRASRAGRIDMVRFSNVETGQEHWIGLDPRSGAWHAWDHPAQDYPGPARELLSTGLYNDPDRLLPVNADQLDLDLALADDTEPFREALSIDL